MTAVCAAEANRQFSRLLRAVQAGEPVALTARDVTVAHPFAEDLHPLMVHLLAAR